MDHRIRGSLFNADHLNTGSFFHADPQVYPNSNIVSAKVRVFMDFLLQEIGQSPPWLEGV
ncbi:MAG: hypothetical protein AAF646_16375 [Pseudomonadota bacterium]